MKLKDGFVLREIDNEYMVVPVSEMAEKIHGIINLSETGAFLWKLLNTDQEEEQLVAAVLAEYEVEEETVRQDVRAFVDGLEKRGFLRGFWHDSGYSCRLN